ncbi:MAG: acyltransferase family protein [Lachnospiraceae bacterium]|nr:acyltransferase family protein [Lachnospiraceae bacterium]
MKNRVAFFDIAKGIGIILVIICHIESTPLFIRQYIVTFHMPAFFIISGMLMNLTREAERPLKDMVKRKLHTIMLPYVIFSIILPFIDIKYYAEAGLEDPTIALKTELLTGLSMTGISVLWFLPALFFSELIVLGIIKNKKRPLIIILILLLIASFWPLSLLIRPMGLMLWRTAYCSFLVMLGYLLFPLLSFFKDRPGLSACSSLILFIILYFTGSANGIVDLHFIVLGNRILYYLNAMIGSLALILISIFIEMLPVRFLYVPLRFFGEHTLFIMLTHMILMEYVIRIGDFVSRHSDLPKALTQTLVNIATMLLVETLLIFIWEKIKTAYSKYRISRNNS